MWKAIAPLRHVIGPLLFLVIAMRIDRDALIDAVAVADLRLVAAAAVVVLFAIPVRAIRWGGIVQRMGHPIALREAMRLSAYATFAGTATPARAGELYKAGPLIARGVPAASALASVFLDRTFDLGMAALVAVLYAAAIASGTGALAVTAGAIGLVCVGGAGFLAGSERELATRHGAARAAAAIAAPPALASTALLTVAASTCAWVANHLLVRSLGLPLDPLQTAGISAAAGLAALLPVSVLGLGTRDAALLLLLTPYGIAAPGAIALATLFLLLNAWTGLACGFASALAGRRS